MAQQSNPFQNNPGYEKNFPGKKPLSLDYMWTKPQTYLVLVPIVSLIIQKIQFDTIKPSLKIVRVSQEKCDTLLRQDEKFPKIVIWHFIGSIAQIIAMLVTINYFSAILFAPLILFPTYELANTLFNVFSKRKLKASKWIKVD